MLSFPGLSGGPGRSDGFGIGSISLALHRAQIWFLLLHCFRGLHLTQTLHFPSRGCRRRRHHHRFLLRFIFLLLVVGGCGLLVLESFRGLHLTQPLGLLCDLLLLPTARVGGGGSLVDGGGKLVGVFDLVEAVGFDQIFQLEGEQFPEVWREQFLVFVLYELCYCLLA